MDSDRIMKCVVEFHAKLVFLISKKKTNKNRWKNVFELIENGNFVCEYYRLLFSIIDYAVCMCDEMVEMIGIGKQNVHV